ncbi:MAG: ferritin-like domain-containing protein [Candidatus Obscuribacterales bacterium]|nr:ferritin-like domain-containing protein [Candidatus Obscuribacterales bacterium]
MKNSAHRQELIHILQMAYSGEKAAALAYAGHWRSARNLEERSSIEQIERDEWEHREIVGKMLDELGARPQIWREVLMSTIGSAVLLACFISGWFFPMYFAGLLENQNVDEYARAAEHAKAAGEEQLIGELEILSGVEQLHEAYFRNKVEEHRWTSLIAFVFRWGAKPTVQTRPGTVSRNLVLEPAKQSATVAYSSTEH